MATVAQNSKLGNVLWPALAWIVAIIFFFPIFWLVFTSFKTDADAVKAGIPVLLYPDARKLHQHDGKLRLLALCDQLGDHVDICDGVCACRRGPCGLRDGL